MAERPDARLASGSSCLPFSFRFSDFFLQGCATFDCLVTEETILRYLFEDYVLDMGTRELRCGDVPVAVEPKVFDLLMYLIENRQRVISKDDLFAHVWDGRIVSDSALFTRINMARSAIGDSGESQRLIKTLPRKGVRFVATVREEQAPSGSAARAAIGAERAPLALILPDRPSIAVLALDNLSGDKAEDYFCDGITEDIITELSRFSELFVIARNSSFQYKGKPVDVRQVARDLGVRYILQGSIRRGGDRVRISVQLIDALTGVQRWAERYDRQLQDVFAVQDEVARTIVAILAAHVNKAEIERTLNKPPETWQAYDYYLRAADAHASYWSSFNATELYEVRRLLEQSIAIDPNYARAYARLAWTHFTAWVNALDGDYLNPATLDRAYHLARKAVQLDPNLPQARAHLAQALVRRGEHEEALAEFERAMALNPNFTDWRFAEVLALAGHPARAIETVERHMRLDPFYVPLAPLWLGSAHYMLKQYPQALPPLRECVSRAPTFLTGHCRLAATYAQLGNIEKARAEAAEALRIDPKYTIERTQARVSAFKHKKDAEHYFDGLRKAGLPER
jgi:adenylate cyclase